MKSRLASILVTAFLVAVFGFGVFLLVVAEETPAPGLIVVAISGAMLLSRLLGHRTTHAKGISDDDTHFQDLDTAHENYDYEVERRRQSNPGTDFHTGPH